MAPTMIKRDLESDGEEGIERRTRIDDTDPRIVFSPGPSPYFDQQQNASWSVVKDSTPFNGSAVMANLPDAALTTLALSSVVDLTPLAKKSAAPVASEQVKAGDKVQMETRGRPWLPYHKQPEAQLELQALTRAKLLRQLSALTERLAPAVGARPPASVVALQTIQA